MPEPARPLGTDDADDPERLIEDASRSRLEHPLDRTPPRLHPCAEMPAGMAKARYDRVQIGEPRFMGGAMPEIGCDGGHESVGMTHDGISQCPESLVAPLRRQRPPLDQGKPLRIEAGLEPVSCRIGNDVVHVSEAPLGPGHDMAERVPFSTWHPLAHR